MKEYVVLKSLIVRKDNIIFVNKSALDIMVAIDNNNNFPSMQSIQFLSEEETDRAFDKLTVALTGDLE